MIPQLPSVDTVRRLLGAARQLTGLSDEAEWTERLVADYARGLATEQRAIVVALVGATGAGKSTLLNALVGSTVATSGERRPTTEQSVVYAPDDATLGALAALGSKVVRYPSGAPGPWSGQVFVDTPDLNSVAAVHRDRARAVVDEADVALVVLHKGSVAEAVQAEFLAPFARRRRVVFVLNHADLLSDEARGVLKDQVRHIATERLGVSDAEVYAISALAWLEGRVEAGERTQLLEALRGLADRTVAERIRRSNALGALRELQTRVAPVLAAADEAAERRARLLAEGMTKARVQLAEDFRARLETASAHLGHAIRQEAARRFWGPAGWWMRMTLAGTSGLGAAALLVRGNPLIAGGVAVGSALASRLQQFTLQRGAEHRMQGELSDEVTVSAAKVALGPARADVAQMGLSPEDAALPSIEDLAESMARVRASAWEATAHLALADAVQRWWKVARFILLPLVNLPLLALFGHVAYKVVRGYLEGPYVGSDFLLNALALAALFAAAGAGIASLTLAGIRRRIMSVGRAKFDGLLAGLSGDLVEAAKNAQRESRDAARQVLTLVADA